MNESIDAVVQRAQDAIQAERWGEAVRHAKLAAELQPTAERWVMLALAFHGWEQPDQALAAAEQAIHVDPVAPLAWSMVAEVQASRNRYPAALDAARRAAELDPQGYLGLARIAVMAEAYPVAEAALAALERSGAEADPVELSDVKAVLWSDALFEGEGWHVNETDKGKRFAPISKAAMVAASDVLDRVSALPCQTPQVRAIEAKLETLLADNRKRTFSGNPGVVVGACILSLGCMAAAGDAPVMLLPALVYGVSSVGYVLASQTLPWQANARIARGDHGTKGFLMDMAGDAPSPLAGCMGFVVGVMFLGALAPLLTLFNWISNRDT